MHTLRNLDPLSRKHLNDASKSLYVCFNYVLNSSFFQFLLQKAKKGIQVRVICPETCWDQLALPPRYQERLEHFQGEVLLLEETITPDSVFLVIIDKRLVLQGPLHLQPQQAKQLSSFTDRKIVEDRLAYFTVLCQKALKKSTNLAKVQDHLTGAHSIATDKLDQKIQITFKVSPNSVIINQLFELQWEVKGAQKVLINYGLGQVPHQGCKVIRAKKSLQFELTAHSEWGKQVANCKLDVDPKPLIEYHLTSPDWPNNTEIPLSQKVGLPNQYAIVKGQLVRLRWKVYQAESVHITTLGEVVEEGYKDLLPKELGMYTITAMNQYGTTEKTILIHVFELPELGFVPPKLESIPSPNIEIPSLPSSAELEGQHHDSTWWDRLKRFVGSKNVDHE